MVVVVAARGREDAFGYRDRLVELAGVGVQIGRPAEVVEFTARRVLELARLFKGGRRLEGLTLVNEFHCRANRFLCGLERNCLQCRRDDTRQRSQHQSSHHGITVIRDFPNRLRSDTLRAAMSSSCKQDGRRLSTDVTYFDWRTAFAPVLAYCGPRLLPDGRDDQVGFGRSCQGADEERPRTETRLTARLIPRLRRVQ